MFGIFPESSIISDQEQEPMPYVESSTLQRIHSDEFKQLLNKVAISAWTVASITAIVPDEPTLPVKLFDFLHDSSIHQDDDDEDYISYLGKRKQETKR